MRSGAGVVVLAAVAALMGPVLAGCSASAPGKPAGPSPRTPSLRVLPAASPPPATPSTQIGAAVPDTTGPGSVLGPWHMVDHTSQLTSAANEGVVTVPGPQGIPRVLFRGSLDIPSRLRAAGWTHVGDPDAAGGVVIDAYQTDPARREKLYEVSTPGGAVDYLHPLAPGELSNNTIVAVAPRNRGTVTGEWQVMRRLLVLPTPWVNPSTPRRGGSIALAGTLTLDHPVRDVQGCDFVTDTRLLCVSDDAGTDLWPVPDQLLQVDLRHPLDGRDATAHVSLLGQVPLRSACSGTFEVEGIDYSAVGDLRIEVVPPLPCGVVTTVYRYRQEPG